MNVLFSFFCICVVGRLIGGAIEFISGLAPSNLNVPHIGDPDDFPIYKGKSKPIYYNHPKKQPEDPLADFD